MANKTITINVSVQSIEKAIHELEVYKVRLEQRLNELIDRMCKDGESYAIINYPQDYIDTGGTLGSIMAYRQGNQGIIEVGGNAIWIEFGTGVAMNGADDFHDRSLLGINEIGTYGKGHGSDPHGWWYYDENDHNKL